MERRHHAQCVIPNIRQLFRYGIALAITTTRDMGLNTPRQSLPKKAAGITHRGTRLDGVKVDGRKRFATLRQG